MWATWYSVNCILNFRMRHYDNIHNYYFTMYQAFISLLNDHQVLAHIYIYIFIYIYIYICKHKYSLSNPQVLLSSFNSWVTRCRKIS